MKNFRLLLGIVRELRYETLHTLIDKEVTVESLDAIYDPVAALAERHLEFTLEPPDDATAMSKDLEGALRKYGYIDFQVPCDATIQLTKTENAQKVRALGFAPRLDDDDRIDDEADCFISELHDGMSSDTTWLKLFLHAQASDFMSARPQRARDRAYLHDGVPLPMTFRVVDACVTNAPFVWFHRHLYL